MREAQLDKVYDRSSKCHRAGPDISWLDTESEPERESSQGERISTSDQNKCNRVAETFTAAGTCTPRPPIIETRLLISLQGLAVINAFILKVIGVAHQNLLRNDKHCTCVLIGVTTITERAIKKAF